MTNPTNTPEATVMIARNGETIAVFCSPACVERHYEQNAWHGETEAIVAADTIPIEDRYCHADPCKGDGFFTGNTIGDCEVCGTKIADDDEYTRVTGPDFEFLVCGSCADAEQTAAELERDARDDDLPDWWLAEDHALVAGE